jgi:hypothetical protein
MHLCTVRCPTDKHILWLWANYETWLQSILDLAVQVKAKIVLFKTVNFICEDAFRDAFQRASREYHDQNTTTIERCEAVLMKFVNTNNDTAGDAFPVYTKDVQSYCRNGAFTERGVRHLNQQIYKFVNQLDPIEGLVVGVFNDHDVESCPYTTEGDGRHYHSLNLLRLRSMSYVIRGIELCTQRGPLGGFR